MATKRILDAAHRELAGLLHPHPEHVRAPILEAVAAASPVFQRRVIYRLCYRSNLQIPRFDAEVHGSGGRFSGDDVLQVDALGIFVCPSDWGYALRPPDDVSLTSLGLALPGGRVVAPEEVLAQRLEGSRASSSPGAPEPLHPLLTLACGGPYAASVTLEPKGGYWAGYRSRAARDAALEEIRKHVVTTGVSEAKASDLVAEQRARLASIDHRAVLVRERPGRSDGSTEAVYGDELFHFDWRRRFSGKAFVVDEPPQPAWEVFGIVELPTGSGDGVSFYPAARQLVDHSAIARRYDWL